MGLSPTSHAARTGDIYLSHRREREIRHHWRQFRFFTAMRSRCPPVPIFPDSRTPRKSTTWLSSSRRVACVQKIQRERYNACTVHTGIERKRWQHTHLRDAMSRSSYLSASRSHNRTGARAHTHTHTSALSWRLQSQEEI